MTRDLLEVVNESGRETFQKLAGHVDGAETRQFGAITGVSTGFPAPVYNQLIAFEAPASDDLQAGVEWMDGRDVPFWFSLPESVAETDAVTPSAFDLIENDEIAPAMALPSLTDIPANSTPASIAEVTDSNALQEFIQIFSDVFGMPEPLAERAHPESMLDDPDMGLFVGRIDEQPVACGHLVKTDEVAGVYSIGVVEESRRQGIGEAMTWAVLRAGRDAGCDIGALQSSEMAYSLYQTMGFETVTRYHRYESES
jgi:ribosomal protein S18 acetylase RimI-like enzyme